MDRDVEAVFALQGSPKNDALVQEHLTDTSTCRASLPRLLLASMPRMLIQIASMAQLRVVRSVSTRLFTRKLISLISPLTTMLISVVVGAISDRCTHQWGRRRPFLVFATLASAGVLFLSYFTADIGEAIDGDSSQGKGTSFFAVVFVLANALAIDTMTTPAKLLVADLAGDRQITGAAVGQGRSILRSIFVMTYIEAMSEYSRGSTKVIPESSWGPFVAVCILFMLMIAGVVVYNIQEPPRESSSETRGGVLTKIIDNLASLPTMLIVYGNIIVLIAYGIFNYNTYRRAFFRNRVDTPAQYYASGKMVLGLDEYQYFIIQQICAYIFTWRLPWLTNKFGANHVLTISLGPQALLIIMAFLETTTVVGLMDSLVNVFGATLDVLAVPAIVHVYGTKNIGVYVGALTSIASLGQLIAVIIGDGITKTDIGYQLPVLLAGIMALMSNFISAFLLHLNLKSL